jgi:hypothetical protein
MSNQLEIEAQYFFARKYDIVIIGAKEILATNGLKIVQTLRDIYRNIGDKNHNMTKARPCLSKTY